MRIIDITHGFYENMPAYPASWYPRFAVHTIMAPETDPARAGRTFTRLELFAHNATHVDVPSHFYKDGATLDQVPLTRFIGRTCVADLSSKPLASPVTGEDLEQAVGPYFRPGDRLLIRTDHLHRYWGKPEFWECPPYLTASAAQWAVDHDAALVGLDCLTEKSGDRSFPVHKLLLGAGIPILEYITDLHKITRPVVHLMALPTKIHGVEAAPVRALVLEGVEYEG